MALAPGVYINLVLCACEWGVPYRLTLKAQCQPPIGEEGLLCAAV